MGVCGETFKILKKERRKRERKVKEKRKEREKEEERGKDGHLEPLHLVPSICGSPCPLSVS